MQERENNGLYNHVSCAVPTSAVICVCVMVMCVCVFVFLPPRVWNLGAKGSVSLLCEVDVPEAISATWHPHDRILVAQLHNKLSDIDLRKAGGDKDKKRQARKLVTRANGDEVCVLLTEGAGGGVAICIWEQ